MNGHHSEESENVSAAQHNLIVEDGQPSENTMDTLLESRITRLLHEKASGVHFTPAARAQVMARISSRSARKRLPAPALAFVAAATLALVLFALLVQSFTHPLVTGTTLSYTLSASLQTPAQLAHGGHLVSLAPTGQHIVYQAASGNGTMYTADVQNPDASNTLAMRDARDAAWSPDGSALVATIEPKNTTQPFLALIRTGSYMTPLGHTALAASWSPTNSEQIVYANQTNGAIQLFSTIPAQNQPAHLLTTLHLSATVQRLVWSPDGHTLLLVTTQGASGTAQQAHPTDALYALNVQTFTVKELVTPGNSTIGTIAWSPNSRYLAYEQVPTKGKSTIQALDMTAQDAAFTITLQGTLNGESWSPSSNALVYSDSGKLATHILHGTAIHFAQNEQSLVSPLWLPDGRILCLNVIKGTGTLDILSIRKE